MLTSAATASARPPSSRIAAAVCCASSSERSATITDAPSRAHVIAVARPLPIESLSPAFAGPSAPPPTINATLPVRRAMICLRWLIRGGSRGWKAPHVLQEARECAGGVDQQPGMKTDRLHDWVVFLDQAAEKTLA